MHTLDDIIKTACLFAQMRCIPIAKLSMYNVTPEIVTELLKRNIIIFNDVVYQYNNKQETWNTGEIKDSVEACLDILGTIQGFKIERERDRQFLLSLQKDFPSVDFYATIKNYSVAKIDTPLTAKSKPRSQLFNWFRMAVKFQTQKCNPDIQRSHELSALVSVYESKFPRQLKLRGAKHIREYFDGILYNRLDNIGISFEDMKRKIISCSITNAEPWQIFPNPKRSQKIHKPISDSAEIKTMLDHFEQNNGD